MCCLTSHWTHYKSLWRWSSSSQPISWPVQNTQNQAQLQWWRKTSKNARKPLTYAQNKPNETNAWFMGLLYHQPGNKSNPVLYTAPRACTVQLMHKEKQGSRYVVTLVSASDSHHTSSSFTQYKLEWSHLVINVSDVHCIEHIKVEIIFEYSSQYVKRNVRPECNQINNKLLRLPTFPRLVYNQSLGG